MNVLESSRVWLRRSWKTYRCRYCGKRYARNLPNCPVCKTGKHSRGDVPVPGAMY